ncbi:hypothetical protein JIG36_35420 [Actinoplanes sp. LDG1-06]|uniref:Uncharacterized protein n=1 Tax=Paractinoplanes ovalisporus TaxID=2810368 RepID=A0ABS2ALQ4_9ACTN|nr:hypothetical protein [Actinoplanes ovalisporus]MBM2620804.1 hypothetical protein [Actinoplanes ovalisporus]
MRFRDRPWRLIATLSLLVAGLLGAALVGNSTGFYDLDAEAAESDHDSEIRAHPGRSLDASCYVEPASRPAVGCSYKLTLRAEDQLVQAWNRDELGIGNLVDVIGLPYSWTFSDPTLDYLQDRSVVSMAFTGGYEQLLDPSTGAEDVVFASAVGGDSLVRRQTWHIHTTTAVIAGVTASKPDVINAKGIELQFDPGSAEDNLTVSIGAGVPIFAENEVRDPDRPILPRAEGDVAVLMSTFYWSVCGLLPWIALAVLTRRKRHPTALIANRVAVAIVFLAAASSVWIGLSELGWWPAVGSRWEWFFPSAASAGGVSALISLTLVALPVAFVAVFNGGRGLPHLEWSAVRSALIFSICFLGWAAYSRTTDGVEISFGWPVIAGLVLLLTSSWFLPGEATRHYIGSVASRGNPLSKAALCLGTAVIAMVAAVVLANQGKEATASAGWFALGIGVLVTPIVTVLMREAEVGWPSGRIAAHMLAVLSTLPPVLVVSDPSGVLDAMVDTSSAILVGGYMITLLGIVTVILSVTYLRSAAATGSALRNPLAWVAATVLVASLARVPNARSFGDFAAPVLALLLFLIWFRGNLGRGDIRTLSSITKPDHKMLVRAALRQRFMVATAEDLFRSARSKIVSGEVDLPEYDELQARLDDAATRNSGYRKGGSSAMTLERAAFGSHVGDLPWRSGSVAAGYALLLALPAIAIDGWAFVTVNANENVVTISGAAIVAALFYLLRWIGYGLLFGYFYPVIRGSNAMSKARTLMVLMIVPETLQVVANSVARGATGASVLPWLELGTPTSGATVVLGVAVRAGQVIVFCMVLGLLWERRLCDQAGVAWSRLRSFRSLRSLGAPVTAIVVAGATTAATAIATIAVASVFATSPAPPPAADKAGQAGTSK